MFSKACGVLFIFLDMDLIEELFVWFIMIYNPSIFHVAHKRKHMLHS